ncbi:OsmC family protein [Paenisporosarcina cavernae]|uniref:OsmC family peroxiredoxin n=1 Tax=Paenisporosarcina cavernae TaxID=2320858 RepID=A0A385YUU3_9BACL|nr:OsmC family protein [Paenisporosarcina cavernae]AYC30241.1 OsmC family peroxiredoxin [Paenisporosarcina cavernae]
MHFVMNENGFSTELEFGKLEVSSNEEFGFRPYQLLVSSLAVCSGGVLKQICEKMRTPLHSMDIEVKEVVRNPDVANRVEKVHLHFKLSGEDLSKDKLPRIMELTKKNCSMVQSVVGSIDVIETVEII